MAVLPVYREHRKIKFKSPEPLHTVDEAVTWLRRTERGGNITPLAVLDERGSLVWSNEEVGVAEIFSSVDSST